MPPQSQQAVSNTKCTEDELAGACCNNAKGNDCLNHPNPESALLRARPPARQPPVSIASCAPSEEGLRKGARTPHGPIVLVAMPERAAMYSAATSHRWRADAKLAGFELQKFATRKTPPHATDAHDSKK